MHVGACTWGHARGGAAHQWHVAASNTVEALLAVCGGGDQGGGASQDKHPVGEPQLAFGHLLKLLVVHELPHLRDAEAVRLQPLLPPAPELEGG
eukprot:263356-Prorocentrum_minimum.AAC.1